MALLPAKRTREIHKKIDKLHNTVTLAIRIVNKDTGEFINVGGLWSPLESKYITTDVEDRVEIKVHQKQWEFLLYLSEALLKNNLEETKYPIQDIVIHGARRSGKSQSLYIGAMMILLAKPASTMMIVSLRKKQGKNIMTQIMKHLPTKAYTYDKREDTLILANASKVWTRSQVDYDAERGESLDALLLDEASFMRVEVYEALSPALVDRNGVAILASSPPKSINWYASKAKQAKSHDKEKAKAVRVVGISLFDNTFLSKASLNRALKSANTLSKDAYEREILGKFISTTGRALPDFNPELHVVKASNLLSKNDVTQELARYAFGLGDIQYFVGIDFNQPPIACTIGKWDNNGAFWIVNEIVEGVTTETFGKMLYDKLKDLGCNNPYDQAVLIADASGSWQGLKDTANRATWKILKNQGWIVFPPAVGKRANPRRDSRLEVARALSMNVAGEIRLFVDPEATNVIDCFSELEMSPQGKGYPNLRSKHIHVWDAATYPIYRVWGSKLGVNFFNTELVSQYNPEDNEDE